ncbi:Trm112 family protein [Maridesulfovibrio salexigens]|uniref:UPF0434 protein Desal_0061 n=1 Tax=Maridesulfovibrio salexigens (strain ATCC 14822 / DSM 2638 / NCIMB 8403 / VKM B-1763) TaxID=526222 RepID=C6BUZ5_MARSD|nr:Trm112 family protein [Maridesulfovibrio salexigens]ACS78132.1 protein of unknown function DUF343 [Maridesulfovibrio salexigens DSM 2638]
MTLNKELIDILVCPKCKSELELLPGETGLKCDACNVIYPVKDEIPIMLVDEAVPADQWENK